MTNSFRAGLLAATCSLGLITGAPAGAETLAEAVALAYQTNPTLRAQRASLRAVDETVVQARAGYAPTVSAAASANVTDTLDSEPFTNRLTGQTQETRPGTDAISAQLNLSQPVYTGGRIAASVDNARANVLAAREQLRTIEANILLNVIGAYVDVRRDEEAVRIRQENTAVLQRQLEEARARFEVGEITRTDVAQAEGRLALSIANLATTQAQLANSRARYASVVGQNPGQLAPEPSLPPLPATVDEAYAVAETESPLIRTADFAARAARAATRAARAQFAPSVNLQGSARAQQSPIGTNIFGVGSDEIEDRFSLGLNASIPLFSGGLNASRVREALERENQARFQIDQQRRRVLNDVAQSWNQLVSARASLIANQEQVRATRVAFEGVTAEQQVGLRTTLDVLNAQQELRNAELLLIGARRDAYVAEASTLAAMGRLEAQNLIAGVPIYDPTYTVQRRGLREGALEYEDVLERLDRRESFQLERPARTTVPTVEAPFQPDAEWRPQSAPVVVPQAPPPPVTPQPASPPVVGDPVGG
ncbi:MAG: TolC family outer membrane protein [Proteobacteria bacterium]|nr:TolC family outer membrane protein [Pseudomonadota bacterium]